jgi:hypothetical protein
MTFDAYLKASNRVWLLDRKAEKLFDSLISAGDSPADRRAALALVQETFPGCKPIIPTWGLREE